MGVKGDLKEARACMQGGDPAQAYSMIQTILDSGAPELKDSQVMYAVLVTSGLTALAKEDHAASEDSFRRATTVVPDAPQAWKGLIDCLERAGKLEALPDALLPAARIAEGKGNHGRARSLRLRLAEVLEGLGRESEALDVLLVHLNNPAADKAISSAEADGAASEKLALVLHVAVLEEAVESTTVAQKAKKRVLKESGITSVNSEKASAGNMVVASAGGDCGGRLALLTFEYGAKAQVKDHEEGGPVARTLEDAMRALEEAACSVGDDPAAAAAAASSQGQGSQAPSTARCQQLVERFVRIFVGKAVRRAECGSNGQGWQELLIACTRCRSALGTYLATADDGWTSAATLLSSTYYHNHPMSSSQNLHELATENAKKQSNPWLAAESCLYLAWVAWSAGDGTTAGTLLSAAQAARLRARSHGSAPPRAATARSPDGLSGPGSNWRELSLECLISEQLGYPGADRDPTVAEAKLDTAVSATEASVSLRGPPLRERDLSGSLALARASLLITMGRLEEARSAVNVVVASNVGVSPTRGTITGAIGEQQAETGGENEGEAGAAGSIPTPKKENIGGGLTSPRLRCQALCVASDVDLAEGLEDDAKGKLREVLSTDGGFAGALTRLGWLLLGFAGVGPGEEGTGRERVTVAADGGRSVEGVEGDAFEAMRLLERAVEEEPGSSMHAFRLAR